MRAHWSPPLVVLLSVSALAACGADEESTDSTTDEADAGTDSGGGGGQTDGSGAGEGSGTPDDGSTDGPDEPTGPMPNAPFEPTAGSCTPFTAGTNSMTSYDQARTFDVYLPDDPEGAALLFAWHGAGDSAGNFGRAIDAQGIADEFDTVVVVPNALSAEEAFSWQIFAAADQDIDLKFFDDILACAVETLGVDSRYVYTTGFSAGALWSTYLVLQRSEWLSAAVIFSGGVSTFTFPYETPARQIPVILTHGGPSDQVAVPFNQAQEDFAAGLAADGHVVFLCDHGRGHTIPSEAPDFAFPFLFETPFGVLSERYQGDVPSDWPTWCERVR
jgi:predicted esterase